MSRGIVTCSLLVACLLSGCAATQPDADAVVNQKYDLPVVRKRIKQLEPGMSKFQVMGIIGSPAEYRGETWVYLPRERGAAVVPAAAVHVKFEHGRYVSHRDQPIVLGQPLP